MHQGLGLSPDHKEQGGAPGHGVDLVSLPLQSTEMASLGVVVVGLSVLTTPPAQGHLLPNGIKSGVGVQDVITPALVLEAGVHHHLVVTVPFPLPLLMAIAVVLAFTQETSLGISV